MPDDADISDVAILPDAQALDRIVERCAELEREMASGGHGGSYAALASEHSRISPLASAIRELRALEAELNGLDEILADESGDSQLRDLALQDRPSVAERIASARLRVEGLLAEGGGDESPAAAGAVVEVRAGTGGAEAALFAGDLFRMYSRYADRKGWKVELLSRSEGEAGGFKEVVASISGKDAFSRLRFESGAHRVQRVPRTEASGRIHTSAATVAVLPLAGEADIEIRPQDLRVETMRASGAGGQHVNVTDSAVRVTHLPSGVTATASEKSQHRNRANAMSSLRSRLLALERARAEAERAGMRREQVGSGDRSERIRTYNFPQGRVSDHRVDLTLRKLDRILDGDGLDEIVDALEADARRSAAQASRS